MSRDYFNVSIPDDLRQYAIEDKYPEEESINYNPDCEIECMWIYKNIQQKENVITYYSDDNELVKKVYYHGSDIVREDKFRNNICISSDRYEQGKLSLRINYDKTGKQKSTVSYEYNKKNHITSIIKNINGCNYQVIYGYDELLRVNCRKILINDIIIQEQKFRFDILDRIVEYRDNNQKINIEKYNPDYGLISYKIADKIGNNIQIENIFIENKYVRTEITLNGHSSTLYDKIYTDNIMLKKPYTTEDDLDLIIANLMWPKEPVKTIRSNNNSVTDLKDINIKTRALPISIRKRVLYNIAIGS